MKNLILTLLMVFLMMPLIFAQSDQQGMKYQAVARDLSGNQLSNQKISLRISLKDNLNSNIIHYSELHELTTNEFGLFSLVVGGGNLLSGEFDKIPWSTNEIWMEIAIKDDATSNYNTISSSRLLAVPYAFYAQTAGSLIDNPNQMKNDSEKGVPSQIWSLKGNSKTDSEIDKIGTTDEADLVFVTNNTERLRLSDNGDDNGGVTTNSGDLNVIGSTSITKGLIVDGDSSLKNSVTMNSTDGETIINGETTINNISNLNGQVTINANIKDGIQSNFDDYPLRVEGGNQGIAIKINGDAPTRDQNWVTFMNGDGEALGRIEGTFGIIREIAKDVVETIIKGPNEGVWKVVTPDKTFNLNTPGDILEIRNIYFNNSYTEGLRDLVIDQMKSFKDFVIDAAGAGGTACTLGDCDDIIKKVIDLVIGRLKIIAYIKSGTDAGASFESGGADYAEWLKKAFPDEIISNGEVVGIIGGQISKKFTNASQFVTITSNPIIVGAMPKKGSENNFKKVALMGQVPTLVFGNVNIGDYILPSENGDGLARAVNPEQMKANEFSKIIGVAWSNSDNKNMFNYINTAVGFNANQMGMIVNNMQSIINVMQDEIVKLNPKYIPVYFDTNEIGEKYTNLEIAENSFAGCDECGDNIGIEVFKCYIKCWIENGNNGNDINPNSNAIRRIVKKEKSVSGEEINIVIELMQDRAETKIKEPLQGFMDKLFEGGFIDIDNQFDGYPEIKDLLTNIKNLDFSGFNFEALKEKIESIIDRIEVLSQLLYSDSE